MSKVYSFVFVMVAVMLLMVFGETVPSLAQQHTNDSLLKLFNKCTAAAKLRSEQEHASFCKATQFKSPEDYRKILDAQTNSKYWDAPSLIGGKKIVVSAIQKDLIPRITESLKRTGLPVRSHNGLVIEPDAIEVFITIDPELSTSRNMGREMLTLIRPEVLERQYNINLAVYQQCSLVRIPGSSFRAITYQLSDNKVTLDNLESKLDGLVSTFVIDFLNVTKAE